MTDERAERILRAARAERKRPSKALWIVALIVGGLCAIAFAVVLLADGSPSKTPKPQAIERELGFPIGLIVGGVLGIGVGFAIARQRYASPASSESPHSERNRP